MKRFAEEDAPKLARLKAPDLLALALTAPKGYENNALSPHPLPGTENVIDARVLGVKKEPKRLVVRLFAENFNRELEAVFFQPRPFHFQQFLPGARMALRGRINPGPGRMQIIQPKKIGETGTVVPRYKTPLNTNALRALLRKYVTLENLTEEGLPEPVAAALVRMHYPDPEVPALKKGEHSLPEVFVHALKYAEIFRHLRFLRTKKRTYPALKRLVGDPEPFLSKLPFTPTGDQMAAILQIRKDLAGEEQARRLIVGDVGCGKTIVMLASAFMAYPEKSAIMAPTSILANQIYEEAEKFLPDYFKTVLVTQKSGASDEELREAQLLVGTHALLYRELPEVALVMADEQHRFGTGQRKRLAELTGTGEKLPHYLQFSATPIPRTQAMIDSSLIDITTIKEIPFKKKVETTVIDKTDFPEVLEQIRREVAEGRQVLIVYPLVEESENFDYQSIDEARGFWEKRFDGVFVTHGKDKEKEEILMRFREEGNILLATTVVEVGISLPKLSTVVISGADRLGLATLHQLRGRVSRTGLDGYCYLFTHDKNNKRLNELARTKSGFDVAELDLKYRQSGDLLSGTVQSGKSFQWFDMAEDLEILVQVKKRLLSR